MTDISKFKFPEAFNDESGKTSALKVAGFSAVVVGLVGFLLSGTAVLVMIVSKLEKDPGVINFMNGIGVNSLALVAAGLSALGVDKVKDAKPKQNDAAN